MALKTVWIVPRWSGRLERGGYVKGHDPEISKAPTRRSCFHGMTSYVYVSLWLGQRSHGKAERSSYSVHTSDSTWLDCKHSWYRWHEFQSWWIVNQQFEARKETKQSHVLTRSWMWSGSELVVVVVWIGSGSGSGSAQKWAHMFVYAAAWMQHDKKRTTRCAGSKYAAWLLGRLALQLATVSAWQFDSLDVQQLQLGC